MKTIKLMACLMLAMLVVSAMPIVLAQDDVVEDEELPKPGLGPKSAFYGLENGWDKWRLAWTFNKEKKLQKAIEIAEERLAEAKEAAEQGEDEAAEEAQKRYEEFIAKAEGTLEKIQAKKEAGVEKALGQTVRAQERIEAHKAKVESTHNRILERARIRNASEDQLAHLEEVFGRIQTRAEKTQDKVLLKQEGLATRYKVFANKTDEEVEEVLEGYRTQIRERIQNRTGNGYREGECRQDSDCPVVQCVTTPCPQHRCQRNTCILDEDSDSEEDDLDKDSDDDSEDNDSGQGQQAQTGQN